MIAKVILWQNGMVMVFDAMGRQMHEYQGVFKDKRPEILRDAPEDAIFSIGIWQTGKMVTLQKDLFTVATCGFDKDFMSE